MDPDLVPDNDRCTYWKRNYRRLAGRNEDSLQKACIDYECGFVPTGEKLRRLKDFNKPAMDASGLLASAGIDLQELNLGLPPRLRTELKKLRRDLKVWAGLVDGDELKRVNDALARTETMLDMIGSAGEDLEDEEEEFNED